MSLARPADLLEQYRRGFETRDPVAIADLFAFPVLLIGDDGADVGIRAVRDRAEWEAIVAGLLDSYAAMGVVAARIADTTWVEVSERIVQATIRWVVEGQGGSQVYRFTASYTLVREDDEWRIVAIAHDELARLRARSGGR